MQWSGEIVFLGDTVGRYFEITKRLFKCEVIQLHSVCFDRTRGQRATFQWKLEGRLNLLSLHARA